MSKVSRSNLIHNSIILPKRNGLYKDNRNQRASTNNRNKYASGTVEAQCFEQRNEIERTDLSLVSIDRKGNGDREHANP